MRSSCPAQPTPGTDTAVSISTYGGGAWSLRERRVECIVVVVD